MKKQVLGMLLLSVGLTSSGIVRAETEIKRQGGYIYYKTPFRDLLSNERQESVKRSLEMLISTLDANLPKLDPKSRDFASKAGPVLDKACGKVDEVVYRLRDYLNGTRDSTAPGITSLVPSGVLVFLGGAFTTSLKLSGGLSANLGAVLMPAKITRVDLLTHQVTTHFMVDTSWVGILTLDTGVGAGGGGRFRLGAGLIWGPLRSAGDFRGGGIAGKSTFMVLGQGLSVQAGILNQWSGYGPTKHFNPFVMAAWEGGAASTAELQATLTAVVPLGNLIRNAFFQNGVDSMVLEDRDSMGPYNPDDPSGYGGGWASSGGSAGPYGGYTGYNGSCNNSTFANWNTTSGTGGSTGGSTGGGSWDDWRSGSGNSGTNPGGSPWPGAGSNSGGSGQSGTVWDDFMKGWSDPSKAQSPTPSTSPSPTPSSEQKAPRGWGE